MEYKRWARSMPQPLPNPTPNPPYPTGPTPYSSSSSSSYYSHNPNEVSYNTAVLGSNLNPSGTDSYSSYSHNPVGIYDAYAQSSAVPVQNLVVKDLLHQYGGVAQNGAEQLVPATSYPPIWTTPTPINPHEHWKKGPKKIKIVQYQYCDVCKLTCNSKDVLDKHKTGKKHLKNLETLKEAAALTPPSAIPNNISVIGPQEKPGVENISSGQKRSNVKTAEDLETKKKKIMEGGVAASAVRTCGICNVVCNSETVFRTHLAGRKHISMLIGPPPKPVTENRSKEETAEDLEMKKRKILEGGAAASAVRSCGICNVVCNSETVYRLHLSGQKHIAMLEKVTGSKG